LPKQIEKNNKQPSGGTDRFFLHDLSTKRVSGEKNASIQIICQKRKENSCFGGSFDFAARSDISAGLFLINFDDVVLLHLKLGQVF
jgi:hypothetical protein